MEGASPTASNRISQHVVDLRAKARSAAAATRDWLFSHQHADGHWCAELEGDSILQSEYILLLAWLGKERTEIAKRCAEQLLKQQEPSGAWTQFPGAPIDVGSSVKAYFALKLTGHDPAADYMIRARNVILEAGGADKVNSFTRFYLAMLGQIPFDLCPAVPPEMILLPNWSPINIYRMSSWSRTIFVPLAIVWAHRPTRDIAEDVSIRELFINEPKDWPELRCPGIDKPRGLFSWDRFFRTADSGLKLLEKYKLRPLRKRALRLSEQWLLDRCEQSDGPGAIFPPILWGAIALMTLGYSEESPEVRYMLDHLERLAIDEGPATRLQPCKSPVWDTSISLRALAAAGSGLSQPQTCRGVEWLLSKEVRVPGDWTNNVDCEPGGWFFEYENAFYPDNDDTSMGIMALVDQLAAANISLELHPGDTLANTSVVVGGRGIAEQLAGPSAALMEQAAAATRRGIAWMTAMQNHDGGWGAFDKNNDAEFLCHVPFADHNAMIDPSTPDLSARVIESFGHLGVTIDSPGKVGDVVRKAVAYIRANQMSDGSWFGRWGVNYIYGTWQCLVGLRAVGVPADDPAIEQGKLWLLAHQQACGGWGESCMTYEDPSLRGQGSPTASQTAWAMLGLIAAGGANLPQVVRGAQYLMDTQRPDGAWDEVEFTGTGFPRVFYLKYHYYPIYFPLLALAEWNRATARS
ncbi:prenyltransferase/squalene oxidase repeat-containing protein [Blastopirellula marina]|uniref:Squalene--hopene cyclase n=1 Tax=Blastopirellula marina TaxID=124 RepID=A0A2S8F2C9_9BACT|nr:prenyltransferase/squalene oxidase repeat-containing protein [Blastopirellula marina]PQO26321.1 squalene--hopene cyclase [Blastopirellula marina]PTL40721.1 squalene--hopene cyclase [Blastopirellula marina]